MSRTSLSTQTIASTVQQVIAAHRAVATATTVLYHGSRLVIAPNVFSPFIAPSGYLSLSFAAWPIFKGARVLDVGCGSGAFASLVALSGAKRVVCTEINPFAVDNAKVNAANLGVAGVVDVRSGDLFDPAPEEFDIIFADLPFTSGEPRDWIERAFFDSQLKTVKRFFRELPEVLGRSRGSEAFVCLSSLDPFDPRSEDEFQRRLRVEVAMRIDLGWICLVLYRVSLA